MTAISYHEPTVIPTCDARAGWSPRDNAPAFCRVTRGLRSLQDSQGNRRWYCAAPNHRGSIVRLYGELSESEKRAMWGDR